MMYTKSPLLYHLTFEIVKLLYYDGGNVGYFLATIQNSKDNFCSLANEIATLPVSSSVRPGTVSLFL